jgi:hypothetical protein
MSDIEKLTVGDVQFCDTFIPSIDPLPYNSKSISQKIQITSTLTTNDNTVIGQKTVTTQEFQVLRPPGLYVEDKDIYTISPPDKSHGQYETTLPHILFKNPHLPWERSYRSPINNTDRQIPWFCLMMFTADELKEPSQKTFTAGPSITRAYTYKTDDLKDVISGPSRETIIYDTSDDGPSGNVISIESELLGGVLNISKNPIERFTHCRNINTGSKLVDGISEDGFYAVSFTSRFPKPSTALYVHLVSMEPFLVGQPAKTLTQTVDDLVANGAPVNLVSLKSWTIHCDPEPKENFMTYFKSLSIGDLNINTQSPSSEVNSVSQRLANGYTPVKYHLPTGENTIAWYRGPLTTYIPEIGSLPVEDLTASSPNKVVYSRSNDGTDLIIYDNKYKIFDLTYSMAWQLGRNIAIADKTFTTNYLNLRHRVYSQTSKDKRAHPITKEKALIELTKLAEKLQVGPIPSSPGVAKFFVREVPKTVTGNIFSTSDLQKTFNTLTDVSAAGTYDSLLSDVIKWLKDLTTFSKIPFHYLVPHPGMLPKESLRFFNVDPLWIQSLIDGALSISLHFSNDLKLKNLVKSHLGSKDGYGSIRWGYFLRSGVLIGYPSATGKIGDKGQISPDQNDIYKSQLLNKDLAVTWLKNDLYVKPVELIFPEPTEQFRFGFSGNTWSESELQVKTLTEPWPSPPIKDSDIDKYTFQINNTKIISYDAFNVNYNSSSFKSTYNSPSFDPKLSSAMFALQMISLPEAFAVQSFVVQSKTPKLKIGFVIN